MLILWGWQLHKKCLFLNLLYGFHYNMQLRNNNENKEFLSPCWNYFLHTESILPNLQNKYINLSPIPVLVILTHSWSPCMSENSRFLRIKAPGSSTCKPITLHCRQITIGFSTKCQKQYNNNFTYVLVLRKFGLIGQRYVYAYKLLSPVLRCSWCTVLVCKYTQAGCLYAKTIFSNNSQQPTMWHTGHTATQLHWGTDFKPLDGAIVL